MNEQVRPELTVVIVTYNSEEVIRACLRSLFGDGWRAETEVIIVDNKSSDSTRDIVRSEFPTVRLIAADQNGGFAFGVNLGVAHARGKILCLLNPDALARCEQLYDLAASLTTLPNAGIVGPIIDHPTGRLKIVSAGEQPTAWRMFLHYSGFARVLGELDLFRGHYLYPNQIGPSSKQVGWVTGACLLITDRCWQAIGGLSTRWFMYAEDIDLCLRADRAGFATYLDPTVHVQHWVGGSASGHESRLNAAWVTNLFDMYLLRFEPPRAARVMWRGITSIGLRSRAVAFSLRGWLRKDEAWRAEARRFHFYASAVGRAPLSSDEPEL